MGWDVASVTPEPKALPITRAHTIALSNLHLAATGFNISDCIEAQNAVVPVIG
jgi:hypothetical protein